MIAYNPSQVFFFSAQFDRESNLFVTLLRLHSRPPLCPHVPCMRRTVVALLLDATGPLPSLCNPHRKQWAGIPFSCFRSVVDYFVVSKSTSFKLGFGSASLSV